MHNNKYRLWPGSSCAHLSKTFSYNNLIKKHSATRKIETNNKIIIYFVSSLMSK